jgi:hypothetical protein
MKKGMLVIVIAAALSFLASVIAVAPSVAVEATKTKTSPALQKPSGTTQPVSAQPTEQKQNNQALSQGQGAQRLVHEKFWDLAVDRRCVANGVTLDPVVTTADYKIPFLNNKIIGKCFYKVKTTPVNEITEADVKKWGSGNMTYFGWVTMDGKRALGPCKIQVAKTLPKFTWEDVQRWKKVATGNASKIWNESIDFTCAAESPGDYRWFYFKIETQYIGTPIPEYDTGNNKCDTNIQLKQSEFQGTQNKHKTVSQ